MENNNTPRVDITDEVFGVVAQKQFLALCSAFNDDMKLRISSLIQQGTLRDAFEGHLFVQVIIAQLLNLEELMFKTDDAMNIKYFPAQKQIMIQTIRGNMAISLNAHRRFATENDNLPKEDNQCPK